MMDVSRTPNPEFIPCCVLLSSSMLVNWNRELGFGNWANGWSLNSDSAASIYQTTAKYEYCATFWPCFSSLLFKVINRLARSEVSLFADHDSFHTLSILCCQTSIPRHNLRHLPTSNYCNSNKETYMRPETMRILRLWNNCALDFQSQLNRTAHQNGTCSQCTHDRCSPKHLSWFRLDLRPPPSIH